MLPSEIARQYRAKYPDMPHKRLGRIMYAENKLVFKDAEDARFKLRYIAGKTGRVKGRTKDGKILKPNEAFHETEPRPYNPYNLPKSDEAEYTPFVIDFKRAALFADIHVPYHSIEAITAAIKYCKKEKPDTIIIDGDLFDFHGLSKFMKDPRKKKFADEIKTGCELLNILRKEFKCRLLFKLGNHDERYEHFMMMKAQEIYGLEEFELAEIIQKRVDGIEIVSEKRIIQAGALSIVHGHEFGGSVFSPVNIARGFYLRAKDNTIGGHHHRTSEHTEQTITGKIITTWSVGCLSELHPKYLPINSWNHGFAIIDMHGNDFTVHNKRIYKGKVL